MVSGILFMQNLVQTEGIEGRKESKLFLSDKFSHRMISEADTHFNLCMIQFREVHEYHWGSFRIKCQDLSDPDSAQRNQKENLRHCWHFQDCIYNCVASLIARLLQGGIFVYNYKAAAQ